MPKMFSKKTVIISSAGSAGPAEVAWGPDFGEGSGNNTFTVSTQILSDNVALTANKSIGINSTVDNLAVVNDKSIGINTIVDNLAISNNKSINCTLLNDLLSLENTKSVGINIENTEFVTSDILVPHDSWVPTVVLCPDNANKNGTDLEVSGTVAATKDIYMKWDLSGLPASSTVTAAQLKLHVKTAPVLSQTINMFKIPNTDEGVWTEGAITCSNRPLADGGSLQDFESGTTNDTAITINLNSSWLTRIDDRMGVGFCTILLQNTALDLLTTIFESADEGTNNANGPRLNISFNTPS